LKTHGLALMTLVAALVVYLRTLAPSITWRNGGADSGDLVTAAVVGGVPHPPGYPLYTLIASIFARLPASEPAFGVGLFSALSAAFAAVIIFYAARMLLSQMIDDQRWRDPSAFVAALALAFSPMFWSQATIAEVNAFSALLVAALLKFLFSTHRHRLEWVALVFGVGMTHHPTLLLFAPMAWWLLRHDAWTRAQKTRATLLFCAPLVFYLALPLRAAGNPPINWGNPQTLDGFWWSVTAAPYQKYFSSLGLPALLERIAAVPRFLFDQFNVVGAGLGLWGLTQVLSNPARRARRSGVALLLGMSAIVGYAALYGSRDSHIYLLFAFMLFALAIAAGIHDVLARLSPRWALAVMFVALLGLPIFNLAANFQSLDLSRDRVAYNYAQSIVAAVPNDAVILADGDEHLFALWYYRYAIAGATSDVLVVSRELLQYDWYYHQIRQTMSALPAIPPADFSARVRHVIDQSIASNRPVYTTSLGDWLAPYSVKPHGKVYAIERR